MKINNQSRAGWIKLFYYVLVFLYLAITILLLYLRVEDIYTVLGGMSAFVIITIIFTLSLDLNFVIYQESEKKIILRYYPLHPFHHKFKSIEIAKNSLSHFDIENKLLGLRTEIVLYQQTERGLAKYPKVSISALSKSDKLKMIDSLRRNSLKK